MFHVAAGLSACCSPGPSPPLRPAGRNGLHRLGVWGILAANGTWLLGGLPANRWVNLVNLLIGLLGIVALRPVAGTGSRPGLAASGARFEQITENRRQKRRRRKIRKRRTATGR